MRVTYALGLARRVLRARLASPARCARGDEAEAATQVAQRVGASAEQGATRLDNQISQGPKREAADPEKAPPGFARAASRTLLAAAT